MFRLSSLSMAAVLTVTLIFGACASTPPVDTSAVTVNNIGTVNATGVKVVKETHNNETGDYLTLKIFEDGHNQFKSTPAQEDAPHALPCFKPDDLYSYHARATISRIQQSVEQHIIRAPVSGRD